jgi:hypothetical protein
MAMSLAMFLLAGILARDLAARYPVGEVLFLRFLLSLIVVVPFAYPATIKVRTERQSG